MEMFRLKVRYDIIVVRREIKEDNIVILVDELCWGGLIYDLMLKDIIGLVFNSCSSYCVCGLCIIFV